MTALEGWHREGLCVAATVMPHRSSNCTERTLRTLFRTFLLQRICGILEQGSFGQRRLLH
jgi:hypothetical protein